jgi:hypothetical protein
MMKTPILPVVLLVFCALLTACGMTPPAVSTLMQQVTQACQSGHESDLRACYAKEGVSSDQIDQQLGSWDEYFSKDGSPWTFSSIKYDSLAEASSDKMILPMMVAMAQPTTTSGMKTAPNIKVIGFIIVTFKQADGTQGGATEDVGIASDGTAKFALVEAQN